MAGESTTADISVKVAGTEIPKDEVHDILVECELDVPDMAAVVMSNMSVKHSETANVGDDIEIVMGLAGGAAAETVFKGEITGIEPSWETGQKQKVVLRALNKLSLLNRGRKSVAYLNSSDKDIVDKICKAHSLSAEYGQTPPSTKYDHVYQHNQTDLEFLRVRAARIGYELFVIDTKLYFRKRDTSDSGIKLQFGASGELTRFTPRLSTMSQVSEVKVRGYDPENKKEIVGSATPASSVLGDKTGAETTNAKHSNVVTFDCDVPVKNKQ